MKETGEGRQEEKGRGLSLRGRIVVRFLAHLAGESYF